MLLNFEASLLHHDQMSGCTQTVCSVLQKNTINDFLYFIYLFLASFFVVVVFVLFFTFKWLTFWSAAGKTAIQKPQWTKQNPIMQPKLNFSCRTQWVASKSKGSFFTSHKLTHVYTLSDCCTHTKIHTHIVQNSNMHTLVDKAVH